MFADRQHDAVTGSLGKITNWLIFTRSLVFSISDGIHWSLPTHFMPSLEVWCPNWTDYSTWDPTTADQRDCRGDHTDCSPVYISQVIWLFWITTTQSVHFYSVSRKSYKILGLGQRNSEFKDLFTLQMATGCSNELILHDPSLTPQTTSCRNKILCTTPHALTAYLHRIPERYLI